MHVLHRVIDDACAVCRVRAGFQGIDLVNMFSRLLGPKTERESEFHGALLLRRRRRREIHFYRDRLLSAGLFLRTSFPSPPLLGPGLFII